MLFTRKSAALLVLSASALIGTAVISTAPAQAGTAQQRTAATTQSKGGKILCSGDVCIQDFMGETSQSVHVWADKHSFYGHFEDSFGCSIAGCNVVNSRGGEWRAGGKHYSFVLSSAVDAQCVTAWKGTKKTGYKNIGEECFDAITLTTSPGA